jgi:hypothetical protein
MMKGGQVLDRSDGASSHESMYVMNVMRWISKRKPTGLVPRVMRINE